MYYKMIHLDLYPPTDIEIDDNDPYTYASTNTYVLLKYLQENDVKIPYNELFLWYIKYLHRYIKVHHYEGLLSKFINTNVGQSSNQSDLRSGLRSLSGGTKEKISDQIISIPINEFQLDDGSERNLIRVKISRFLIKTEDTEEFAELYLMAPENSNLIRRCVLIRITGDEASLDDLNICYKCTDQKVNPKSTGSLFLSFILRYLRRMKDELEIRTLTVSDTSHKSIYLDNQKYTFNLQYSRQLEGRKPYYMDFGFLPMKLSGYVKIDYNRNKMYSLKSNDYDLSTIICMYKQKSKALPIHIYDDVIAYLQVHGTDSLIDTIRHIKKNYSVIFNQIYMDLFRLFELKELEDEENNYYMDL